MMLKFDEAQSGEDVGIGLAAAPQKNQLIGKTFPPLHVSIKGYSSGADNSITWVL
jgi:hypothetical protein